MLPPLYQSTSSVSKAASAERRLWIASGAYVAFLYAAAYFVQFPLLALRDAGLLRGAMAVVLLVVAVAVGFWLARQRPGAAEVALLLAAAFVYLLAWRRLEIIQERLHLIQYGLMAALLLGAFRARWQRLARRWWRRPALAAALATAAVGWGDEIVQHYLPNRTYDLRDVRLNALSGALFLAVAEARRAVRRRHRASAAVAPLEPRP